MLLQTAENRWPSSLLLVFFGMIATGKSYLASAWAEQHGLPYYNSDRVRKELAGLTARTGQYEEVGQGIYSPAFSRRTYDALLERAEQHFLKDPECCVVLDGSYQAGEERERLLRSRLGRSVRILFVHCSCAESVVQRRLALRAKDPDAVSDGRWEIYLAQKKRFQPLTGTEEEEVIFLDTDAPLTDLLNEVDQALRERNV